ncbi:DUF4332 domain-containing protein [Lignipirellula cremea]|uniref:Zinc dependent phospholipase C n=1 Tax=Lignipirellula cremea TaxID=2528010 RepID=A0A518DY51_9BACT|nr:DUF4332 domain-containing protein [Lignipirellula cremea]QDU96770.1 Zinc dependent phospholipase C [Lignipirellula cremea]
MADDYTSLCYRIVHSNSCRSTHHKLALDALVQIRGRMAERWRNLFLKHYEAFLEGAKAPDSKFQDFRNHVLHVNDDDWGGAVEAAQMWYERLLDLLRRSEWEEAAYAAGVLSHYYTDVIQPLHTAQSEIENQIHRAFEWSVFKSYDALLEMIETKVGYPDLEAPETTNWLAQMIRQGAVKANGKYAYVVDHFQLGPSIKDPPAGLDRDLSRVVAELLAYATIGFSRILEKAFEESAVRPPRTIAVLTAVVATFKAPLHFIARKIHDVNEREIVEGIWNELQETGKVEETLPEDDRVVSKLYEREVLGRRPAYTPRQSPREAAAALNLDARNRTRPEPAATPSVAGSIDPRPAHTVAPRPKNRNTSGDSTPAPTDSPFAASGPVVSRSAAPEPRVEPTRSASAEPKTESRTESRSPSREEAREARAAARAEASAADAAEPRKSIFNLSRYVPKRSARSTEDRTDERSSPSTLSASGASAAASRSSSDRSTSDRSASDRSSGEPRFYLQRSDDVEQAPSIGVKTAKRLERIGVATVDDLLNLDPHTAARQLSVGHIDADTIRDWQHQALLVCRVPNLRGHDAQILVACGFTTPGETASADPEEVLLLSDEFVLTDAGQRVLRGGQQPDLDEVRNWIRWAGQARALQAA